MWRYFKNTNVKNRMQSNVLHNVLIAPAPAITSTLHHQHRLSRRALPPLPAQKHTDSLKSGPALVLLIVTAADGCCVSNGRAVFWLFCPKKQNKRLIWRQMGWKRGSRWETSNPSGGSENPSNSSFLPAHDRPRADYRRTNERRHAGLSVNLN